MSLDSSHPRTDTDGDISFPMPTTSGTVVLASDQPGDLPGASNRVDLWNTWNQDAPLNLNPPHGRSYGGLKALVKHCINEVPPDQGGRWSAEPRALPARIRKTLAFSGAGIRTPGPLFTGESRREILRTSALRSSQKFAEEIEARESGFLSIYLSSRRHNTSCEGL